MMLCNFCRICRRTRSPHERSDMRAGYVRASPERMAPSSQAGVPTLSHEETLRIRAETKNRPEAAFDIQT